MPDIAGRATIAAIAFRAVMVAAVLGVPGCASGQPTGPTRPRPTPSGPAQPCRLISADLLAQAVPGAGQPRPQPAAGALAQQWTGCTWQAGPVTLRITVSMMGTPDAASDALSCHGGGYRAVPHLGDDACARTTTADAVRLRARFDGDLITVDYERRPGTGGTRTAADLAKRIAQDVNAHLPG